MSSSFRFWHRRHKNWTAMTGEYLVCSGIPVPGGLQPNLTRKATRPLRAKPPAKKFYTHELFSSSKPRLERMYARDIQLDFGGAALISNRPQGVLLYLLTCNYFLCSLLRDALLHFTFM